MFEPAGIMASVALLGLGIQVVSNLRTGANKNFKSWWIEFKEFRTEFKDFRKEYKQDNNRFYDVMDARYNALSDDNKVLRQDFTACKLNHAGASQNNISRN